MPYTTELTKDCLGIEHVGRGIVTGYDLLAASITARQLVQNTENFNYELIDFSAVTEMQMQPDSVDRIVAQDRMAAKVRPHAVIVIIAPHDHSYAVAGEWERKVRDLGWTIHISRDRAEALRWLDKHRDLARQELEAAKQKPVAVA